MKTRLMTVVSTWGVAALSLLLVTGVAPAADDKALQARLADPDVIAQGEYLARAGDCIACHTAKGGKPFAGGHSLPTPFGTVYSPNITPDDKTGLGQWHFDDFWQALHHGKSKDGTLLYPAFPYPSYTKVTRDDAVAIFAYLMSLEPVEQAGKKQALSFPYNIRSLLHAWRAMYFSEGSYQPDTSKSDQWNRGAYLVQGLGHCNECHTSRNALGAVDDKVILAGGEIPAQGWYAPNLSMQPGGGLADWTEDDLVEFLQTGYSARGGAFGPMADVVRHSTQYLTTDDLSAIAVYLKTLPVAKVEAAAPIARATNLAAGQRIFEQQCSTCHGKDGAGKQGIYPPLGGNTTVTEPTGVNAIRSVLLGGFPPSTQGNPMPYSMPPYAQVLSDSDVAAVVNYIRQSFGNMAAPVDASTVAKYRALPAD